MAGIFSGRLLVRQISSHAQGGPVGAHTLYADAIMVWHFHWSFGGHRSHIQGASGLQEGKIVPLPWVTNPYSVESIFSSHLVTIIDIERLHCE